MKNASLKRFLLLSVVLSMVLGWGAMASAGAFDGKWSGAVSVDGQSAPAELTIKYVSSVIHFMSPLNCLVELGVPMVDNDTMYMIGVDSCSGGPCDDVWDGELIVIIPPAKPGA